MRAVASGTRPAPDGPLPFLYQRTGIETRDKCSLDILWLRDESLEDSANLPPLDVIAAEIVEDLKAALEQFAEIQAALTKAG